MVPGGQGAGLWPRWGAGRRVPIWGGVESVEFWLAVGGHFEEVEDAANISIQSSQGLGDVEAAGLDEFDGEAS